MELATQTDLSTLRDLLTCRMRELRTEVHAAAQAQREPMAPGPCEVTDRKDLAEWQQASELGAAAEQRDIEELEQVEAALHRLDDGTYGDCADCGEPISMQRLQVQPAAQRCAVCQAARESVDHFRREAP